MSQTVMENTGPNNPNLKPPSTAQMFRDRYQQSLQQDVQQSQNSTGPQSSVQGQQEPSMQSAQPQQSGVSVAAPPLVQTKLPLSDLLLANYPPANQPAQQEKPQTEPAVPQQPVQAPAYDNSAALERQLADERAYYAQREQQWQQAMQQQQEQMAEFQKMRDEYNFLKQQQELATQLADDTVFEGMGVDPDDARKIIHMNNAALQPTLAKMQQEHQQQTQQLEQQLEATRQQMAQQMAQLQTRRAQNELFTAHPDFMDLSKNNVAFQQFMRERDGDSVYTRDQMAELEWRAGNPRYIINLVNKFKGIKPSVDTIQTVPPVQVATNTGAPQGPQQPSYTLRDLNTLVATGQITQQEYRKALKDMMASRQNAMQPPAYEAV